MVFILGYARRHPCPSEEHGGEVGWVFDEDGAGCAGDSWGKRNVILSHFPMLLKIT